MNKNYLIGFLTVLVLVAGIIYLISKKESPSGTASTTSTTSVSVVENNASLPAPQPSQPSIKTGSVVSTFDTASVVTGTIVPNGAFTSYWYEYGTSANLGSKTTDQNLGSGFAPTQASALISGLTKNTGYYFRLVAENRFGKVFGNQLTFKTTVGLPAPIGGVPGATTLLTTNVTNTSANVLGDVTANRGTTRYWFEYGQTTELGNTTGSAVLDNTGIIKTPIGLTLNNLEPGITYYYRLNAQNQFGTVNGAIKSFSTTGQVSATAPKVITNNASGMDATGASLFGTINPNGAETTYWFEYSTDSRFTTSSVKRTSGITVAPSRTTSTVREDLTGLKSKTTYYFRLAAQNNQGSVNGSVLSFKTR